jgi:hypothetical protein
VPPGGGDPPEERTVSMNIIHGTEEVVARNRLFAENSVFNVQPKYRSTDRTYNKR